MPLAGPDQPLDSGINFNGLVSSLAPIGTAFAQAQLAKSASKSAGKAVKSNSTTILLLAGGGGLFLLLVVAMFAFSRK